MIIGLCTSNTFYCMSNKGEVYIMLQFQMDDSMDINPIEDVQLVDLSDDECMLFYFNLLHTLLTEILIEFWNLHYCGTYTHSCYLIPFCTLQFTLTVSSVSHPPLSYHFIILFSLHPQIGFNTMPSISFTSLPFTMQLLVFGSVIWFNPYNVIPPCFMLMFTFAI